MRLHIAGADVAAMQPDHPFGDRQPHELLCKIVRDAEFEWSSKIQRTAQGDCVMEGNPELDAGRFCRPRSVDRDAARAGYWLGHVEGPPVRP